MVDHDTGRLVWAAPGRDKATLEAFFDALGPERAAPRSPMSPLTARTGSATVVAQPLPERGPLRRSVPRRAVGHRSPGRGPPAGLEQRPRRGHHRRRAGPTPPGHAKALKHARYALWKNPENLTDRQQAKLAWIAKTDPRLHRAYLLKEGLRLVFSSPSTRPPKRSRPWIGWARRCRIPAFVDLQRRIVKHQASILAAIEHGLSNGRIESVNTKIRLITRIAFGFAHPEALIALAMLSLGGHPPALPGRT